MLKTFVSGKLHGLHVTDRNVEYNGSVGIDRDLMAKAGIDPYEQVHVVNLRNGERWITYAIPAEAGEVVLNGGSARLGEIGDVCLVITYATADRPFQAAVVFCTANNAVAAIEAYDINA